MIHTALTAPKNWVHWYRSFFPAMFLGCIEVASENRQVLYAPDIPLGSKPCGNRESFSMHCDLLSLLSFLGFFFLTWQSQADTPGRHFELQKLSDSAKKRAKKASSFLGSSPQHTQIDRVSSGTTFLGILSGVFRRHRVVSPHHRHLKKNKRPF